MFPLGVFDHVLECAFAGSENSNSSKFLTQPCQTITRELKLIAINVSVLLDCVVVGICFSI